MKHYPADGCTGQSRPIEEPELRDIMEKVGMMMAGIAKGDYHQTWAAGAWIGQHYGPDGEWMLSTCLAAQVSGLADPAHRNTFGQPSIDDGLTGHDEKVLGMAHYCGHAFKELRDHTAEEITEALVKVRPHVEAFVHYYHLDQKPDARASWEHIYRVTEPDRTNRELLLRGTAGSALLTCWATRYSVTRI